MAVTFLDGALLVCGSRFYAGDEDELAVWSALNAYLCYRKKPPSRLIVGGQVGVDQMAERWARKVGVRVDRYDPLEDDGDLKFTRRNTRMLLEGKPKRGLIFPGGSGTRDMMIKLVEAKVPILFAAVHKMDTGALSAYLSPEAKPHQWLGSKKCT